MFLDTITAALLGSSAWWLPPPPPQCDRAPTRLYTIEYVSPEQCGGNRFIGCINFRHERGRRGPISCRIMIVPSPYDADVIRHEKAHCNCPDWVD